MNQLKQAALLEPISMS